MSGLVYSAHPTALDRLREVAERVAADHDVQGVAAVHRIGSLAIGDIAVIVATTASHRGDAFAASRDLIDIEFPPASVHDGSARARVRFGDGRVTEYVPFADDGYLAEWKTVAALADGAEVVEYDELLADAQYAIALADAAAVAVRAGMSR